MTFTVIIPARYASTRLPGKSLLDLCGKPVVQHVYERGIASGAPRVVIATDDARIESVARTFGAEVVMTSPDHTSGTERIAEVANLLQLGDRDIVVNLQGDEPMMPGAVVRQVAQLLTSGAECVMATVFERIMQAHDVFDPNIVKVVVDANGRAVYFSRAPIPWSRSHFSSSGSAAWPLPHPYLRHVGLYAYRVSFLRQYTQLSPCDLERTEALEQLRVLHHGHAIAVAEACAPTGIGIDTADDLARVQRLMSR